LGNALSERKPLRIVSTDAGVDDALALLFLEQHAAPPVDFVVATGGNVAAQMVAANCAFLKREFALRPALFAGTDPPEFVSLADASHVHGPCGLGPLEPPPAELPPLRELLNHLRASPAAIELLVLGPATDAAAILGEPELARRVSRLVIMGGAVEERAGRLGNVTPFAEFNFHMDPGAAWRALRAAEDCLLVPLDATQQRLFTPAELLDGVGAGRRGRIVRDLLEFLRAAHVRLGSGDGVYLHDVLAAAVWLGLPPFESGTVHLRGVAADGPRRGMLLRSAEQGRPTDYVRRVDAERFLALWGAFARGMLA
jgi:inosine-uridine nucleoside N-ribohydrolase